MERTRQNTPFGQNDDRSILVNLWLFQFYTIENNSEKKKKIEKHAILTFLEVCFFNDKTHQNTASVRIT